MIDDGMLTDTLEPAEPFGIPQTAAAPVISDDVWNVTIGRWITDHLRSTPVSHSTEGWNHLTNVIPRLREILEEEMKKA